MRPSTQGATTRSHHLYVHVPFCRLVCAYCDFVTVGGRSGAIPRYVDALLAEMAVRPASGELATVYFGGGTPSLLPAGDIARLMDAAVDRWAHAPEEVTLETNPSAREEPDWTGLLCAGVNRISLGMQSLRDACGRSRAGTPLPRQARRTERRGQPASRTSAWISSTASPDNPSMTGAPGFGRRSRWSLTTCLCMRSSWRCRLTNGPLRHGRAPCVGGSG